jgi:deoxycytidine triphosphate deaminase
MSLPTTRDESDRLVSAIDGRIDSIIGRAEQQSGMYRRLAGILPRAVGEEICEWRDEQRALRGTDVISPSGNLASMIRGLEHQLMRLDDALSWALSSSGTSWWIQQRSEEIGISDYLVIPRGSFSSDFVIDIAGELAKAFDNLIAVGAIQIEPEAYKRLSTLRLLNVPQYDGLESKWYPILTHELAHLRFDKVWVSDWVAGLHPEQGTAAGRAADHAVSRRDDPRSAPWFERLLAWLTEIACDTVMCFYYDGEGANALESISRFWGIQEDSSTHPAPPKRLLIQRSTEPDCLEQFRSDDSTNMDAFFSRNAFCELALQLRDHVNAVMHDAFPSSVKALQHKVFRQAVEAIEPAIDTALSPSTQAWDRETVRDYPSVVETGLVRALWAKKIVAKHGSYAAYDDRAGLIARSMEIVEFIHRFEKTRPEVRGDASTYDDPIINNLWITSHGIYSEDPAAIKTSPVPPGVPAHDLRLGRYFIAFNRNQIATLNATNMINHVGRIQREVEVAWDEPFVLHPGEMVLGVTLECLVLNNDCTAQVLSRSSVGRLGLLTATAVHIQPGYRGCPTLELVNLSSVPLSLVPGQRIAQVVPHHTCGQTSGYRGHYQNIGWKPQFSQAENDKDTRILSEMRKERLHE